jgi:hypothetical protein
VQLFLRPTTDVNDRLRTMMRCAITASSRDIGETLTAADLEAVELLSEATGRGRGMTLRADSTWLYGHRARKQRSQRAARREACLHREGFTAKVRTVGLGSTFLASAVIGLTLVADSRLSGTVGSGTRPGRILLLAVAGILCVANLALVCAHRAKARCTNQNSGPTPGEEGFMPSEMIRQVLRMIDARGSFASVAVDYELAYQARVAIDQIRFAIRRTEEFAPRTDQLREDGLQLLDALDRLQSTEHGFRSAFVCEVRMRNPNLRKRRSARLPVPLAMMGPLLTKAMGKRRRLRPKTAGIAARAAEFAPARLPSVISISRLTRARQTATRQSPGRPIGLSRARFEEWEQRISNASGSYASVA